MCLYYFNWVGTPEEFREYVGRIKTMCDGIEGVEFRGVFVPSSEWNAVLLLETPSLDKGIQVYRDYMTHYGRHPKIPLGKLEMLLTFEELGYPQ